MKKTAIFIDAFISSNEKKKWFDYNISNFIKSNQDIFIISNKMPCFDKFEYIKYFEYDSRNRLLNDRSKYTLPTHMYWTLQLYDDKGNNLILQGHNNPHGFTNWTILYNLKKICKVLKSYGYEYMIRCEYDVVLKNYDLMNTIFNDFETNEKSKICMIMPGEFGCVANLFLININYLDSKIPEMESEEDYIKFLYSLYGCNLSPVFEELFDHIVKNDCEYLNPKTTFEYIENIGICLSDGDVGRRNKLCYNSIFMTPINNNKEFLMINNSIDTNIYGEYSTENSSGQTTNTLFSILPGNWVKCECSKFVQIKTSEMKANTYVRFDLSNPCNFTLVKN
jgi:hypothetical protein